MFKYKIIIQNFLLVALMLVFGLSVLEITANRYIKAHKLIDKLNNLERIISNADRYPIGRFDKDLGWGFIPNSRMLHATSDFQVEYVINSKGNRDKEAVLKKPPTVFRVIALGESTVFGEGVDYGKRFTEIMEESPVDLEVINMGVRGFGADQSLLQLKRDGFQFQADAVMLFIINDFVERCKYIFRNGNVKPRFILNSAKNGLKLQNLQTVEEKYKRSYVNKKPLLNDVVKNKEWVFFSKSNLIWLLNYNMKMRQIGKRNKGFDREHWKQIYKDLDNEQGYINAYNQDDFYKLVYFIFQQYSIICKKQGVDLIVVFIDTEDKLNLKKICRQLDINYLDLSKDLINAAKIKPLTFEIDPHYNDSTHKIIGNLLSDYLKIKYHQ